MSTCPNGIGNKKITTMISQRFFALGGPCLRRMQEGGITTAQCIRFEVMIFKYFLYLRKQLQAAWKWLWISLVLVEKWQTMVTCGPYCLEALMYSWAGCFADLSVRPSLSYASMKKLTSRWLGGELPKAFLSIAVQWVDIGWPEFRIETNDRWTDSHMRCRFWLS